jgi:Dolichyl-phosphate-mannose-protein mannosyltransferase
VQNLRKSQLALVAITIAALTPFLNKAFHIDDPLFLWMAQQIAKHPLDPYGFTVHWGTFPQAAFERIQNPPLCSYYMALVSKMVGWSEPALHVAFLLWPVLAVLGTFALALRFLNARTPGTLMLHGCASSAVTTDSPSFNAALLTLFTPAFLVSATNLMCDVMMLALWIWSIELWLRGLERQRFTLLVFSAVLIAATTLTKYFGIALVPLLATYTIVKSRAERARYALPLCLLLIPIICTIAFELWTKSLYGRGLIADAMFYTRTVGRGSMPAQFIIGLAFLGGSIFVPILFLFCRPFYWIVIAIFAAVAVAAFFLMPMTSEWQLGSNEPFVRVEGGLFIAIGVGIIALAFADLVQTRSAESCLLFLWVTGALVFVACFNWSITARTVLPVAPATAILLSRRWRIQYWHIISAGVVSAIIAFADFREANVVRETVHSFEQRFRAEPGKIWFQSHWGFQYYMEKWGATPLNSRDSEITSGDVMIVPANNVDVVAIPPERIFTPDILSFPVLPLISTGGLGTGAGFYSHVRGPIPWAISRVPPEKFYVARFR